MSNLEQQIRDTMRDIPDFPKPGILFKDITPVLSDPALFGAIVDAFAEQYAGEQIDAVIGMESRGFLFGAPLALKLGCAFVPARKPGKLPYETVGFEYDLEYGTNRLEVHIDAFSEGQRVLVVDDLLATGGTARATCNLVETLKAQVVACCFVVELGFLNGRAALGDIPCHALVTY